MENPLHHHAVCGICNSRIFSLIALTKKHLQIIIEIVTLMTLVLLWKIQMIVVGQIVDYNQVSQVKTVTLTWNAIAIAICSLASYI